MDPLPKDFLLGPGPPITASRIDFATTELPEYEGSYAVQLDGVLSSEECSALIRAAEATTSGVWERAMINVGNGEQTLMTDVRSCGRIIWDSQELATRIWRRMEVVGHVKEILRLDGDDRSKYLGVGPVKRREIWEFTRPNERMRFLKYEGGEYFRPHCDGCYVTPDEEERSYFTMHLYLNGDQDDEPLKGGSTRFHDLYMDENRSYDVQPATGRVLLFQQRNLRHSGEDVEAGVKYTVRTDCMYRLAGHEDAEAPIRAIKDIASIKGSRGSGWVKNRR